MNTKVSVCITTFNLEKYINKTVDSILAQKTDFDFEILIGDDASCDKTPEILKNYQKEYPDKIRIILHDRNVGVNKNDYSLISQSNGEYIAWCDGDDYWIDPDKLQKQVDILDNNPDYSCVHTAWINFHEEDSSFDETKIQQYEWERTLKGAEYAKRILLNQSSGCRFSSLLFRKKILTIFFDTYKSEYLDIPHLQNDLSYFCILGLSGPFYYLPDTTTVYRIRKESLSFTQSNVKRANYALALCHLHSFWAKLLHLSKDEQFKIFHPNINFTLLALFREWNVNFTLNDIRYIAKHSKYRFTIGEKIILLSLRYKWIKAILSKKII